MPPVSIVEQTSALSSERRRLVVRQDESDRFWPDVETYQRSADRLLVSGLDYCALTQRRKH